MKYYVEYGCYLGMDSHVIETDISSRDLDARLYEAAIDTTDSWLGLHGFYCSCYDEATDEMTYGECCRDTVEEYAEYCVVDYDEDKHGDEEVIEW